MTEVEILWPESLARDRLSRTASELEADGVTTTCRLQPVRRGAENAVFILITTSALEPFLKALFHRVGEDAFHAFKRFVGLVFGRDDADGELDRAEDAPDVVVFESVDTRDQLIFTSGLPDQALRKALELDPESEPGRWMWDAPRQSWLRFEDLRH